MLVNEYKPEFYDRKVRKMRNLGNNINIYKHICGSPFVMSRTDVQNRLYSIFNTKNQINDARVKYRRDYGRTESRKYSSHEAVASPKKWEDDITHK